MSYLGQAALTWSATSEASPSRVHLLQAPLRELVPGHTQTVYAADSLDKTVIETFVVGSGAHELVTEVRYDTDGVNLIDLIRAGTRNANLTYYPNLADADTSYIVKLIAPRSPSDLKLDNDRGKLGEHSVSLRFRRTDQSPFPALIRGTDVLFRYDAGDSLEAATFARITSTAAPATFASVGFGQLSTAKTNQARLEWIANPSSIGPRISPVLLMETSRKNFIKDSANQGTANWTVSGVTRSSAQSDPKGGTGAWKLTGSTGSQYLQQQVTLGSSGIYAASLFVGSTTAVTSRIRMETTNGTLRGGMEIAWSSGMITSFTALGNGKLYGTPTRWSKKFYRIGCASASSTPWTAAQKCNFRLVPTITGSAGALTVYGAQIE